MDCTCNIGNEDFPPFTMSGALGCVGNASLTTVAGSAVFFECAIEGTTLVYFGGVASGVFGTIFFDGTCVHGNRGVGTKTSLSVNRRGPQPI